MGCSAYASTVGSGERGEGAPRRSLPSCPRSMRCTGRSRAGGRPLVLFAPGHSRVGAASSRRISFQPNLVEVDGPAYWTLVP